MLGEESKSLSDLKGPFLFFFLDKIFDFIYSIKGPFQHPNIRTLCYVLKQVSLFRPVESS